MISREEIDAKSAELGVDPSHVQRDYVFGWVLAGLYDESRLGKNLILKGGNAFRKGYFGGTRFSEDLDFASPGRRKLSSQMRRFDAMRNVLPVLFPASVR